MEEERRGSTTLVLVDLDKTGQWINIHAEWRHKDLCKTLPGCSFNSKENVYRLPLSWAGCLSLRSTFRRDLEIGPALTAWAVNEREVRVDPATTLKNTVGTDEGDQDLFPHQRAGVAFLATARQALLADEPGVGKTAQAIRGLKALNDKGEEIFPALVVGPNTLKKNWEREFEKWWPGVRVLAITGTATQRRKQLEPLLGITPKPKRRRKDEPEPEPELPPQVIVMNYEALRSHSKLAPYGSVATVKCPDCGGLDQDITIAKCQAHERELNAIDFRSVIVDEAHRIKNPTAASTRALKAATGDAEFRFALTGTPITQNVIDLWSILNWLNPKEWPAKSRWIDRMVNTMTNGFGGLMVQGIKPEMADEFHSALDPRMRRTLKAIVLPWLPPVMEKRKDVEMSPRQKKAYDQMRDNFIAELEDGQYLSVTNNMTKAIRLLQFASAFAEVNETTDAAGEIKVEVTLSEPSAKIDAFMDDIDAGDFGDDSVAVMAVSRQLIELLSARLTKAKIEHGLITGTTHPDARQRSIDDFQAGRIKFILFTAQAGGVGVTLTAARWLVRLQRPWSSSDDKQARDRVYRIGSEIHDSIVILDYVAAGTVEERVRQVLEAKAGNFEEVVRDNKQLLALLKDDKDGKL